LPASARARTADATALSTQRHRKPENWISGLALNGHGISEQGDISSGEKGVEALLMGLRLAEGVALDRIATLSGREPVDRNAVERLERQGLLALEGERLRATPAGMLVLDSVLSEIVRT
jgi:oxygen-independent coproporphyrinogen-3 oxidase